MKKIKVYGDFYKGPGWAVALIVESRIFDLEYIKHPDDASNLNLAIDRLGKRKACVYAKKLCEEIEENLNKFEKTFEFNMDEEKLFMHSFLVLISQTLGAAPLFEAIKNFEKIFERHRKSEFAYVQSFFRAEYENKTPKIKGGMIRDGEFNFEFSENDRENFGIKNLWF